MKFNSNLSEFNRRFADVLLPSFPNDIVAVESSDGTLLFRGPIPLPNDLDHVGTHVAVSLEKEVYAALAEATPSEREEMTQRLIDNLGTQVRMQYDPNKTGQFALDVIGTMQSIRG